MLAGGVKSRSADAARPRHEPRFAAGDAAPSQTVENGNKKDDTMSQRTLCFIALIILVAALTTHLLGGAREPDSGAVSSGTAAAGAAAAANCGPLSYNRSVDGIGFKPNTAGGTDIQLEYSLRVGDTAGAAADLSADILVETIVGGSVVSSSTFTAEFGFLGNDAVTCAVSCASPCGSIFGDGVCAGCDCDYSRSATLPGILLAPGDMVRATILPLAAAAPEIRLDDDELEVTFGGPSPCCPWDFDGDDMVGVLDFLALLAHWGACP
jgi:hypothetical protein